MRNILKLFPFFATIYDINVCNMNTLERLGDLTEALKRQHEEQPFEVLMPRNNLERVKSAAKDLGLLAVPFRGAFAFPGADADHVWIGVKTPESQDLLPVDVAFPAENQDFLRELGFLIGSVEGTDKEQEELVLKIARQAPFEQRTLGTPPKNTRYIGQPAFMHR